MKIKMEMDLTPEEAKELFVPGDQQHQFSMMLYEAYVKMMQETILKHVDPYDAMGLHNKEK